MATNCQNILLRSKKIDVISREDHESPTDFYYGPLSWDTNSSTNAWNDLSSSLDIDIDIDIN